MGVLTPTVNKFGIPCIQSTGVTINTNNVIFSFAPLNFANINFNGIIAVKINQEITSGTTTTLPIIFQTTNNSLSTASVVNFNNENVTVANWSGTGIYLVFYDRSNNYLQLINGFTATA